MKSFVQYLQTNLHNDQDDPSQPQSPNGPDALKEDTGTQAQLSPSQSPQTTNRRAKKGLSQIYIGRSVYLKRVEVNKRRKESARVASAKYQI